MKILIAASEAAPFVKTGGLADAVSALALTLAKMGHEVRIVIPRYYRVDVVKCGLRDLEMPLATTMNNGEVKSAVYTTDLDGSSKKNPIHVYFIDHNDFFGSKLGIYGEQHEPDYADNPKRFIFFSKIIFELCRKLEWYPDILHAHDWQTALAPVFLKYGERRDGFEKTASILTIHNLGYQGIYHKENYPFTDLSWDVFYQAGFEDWNMMNFLKAGILSADKLNTVSPRYAQETQTQAFGFRLDSSLRYRAADYIGILNGIDTRVWNPKKDPYIPMQYGVKNMKSGKAKAKESLQREFGLPQNPSVPVIGMATRLTEQKGVGELFGPSYGSAWSICRDMKLQLVLVGTGDAWCENEIRSLASRLSNFKAKIEYSEYASHLIEAGSDFFLMPSRYEPSGLNQMYSLAYGTLPIVRNTGGLADTVENFNQNTGEGTGFMFDQLNPRSIYDTVGWANWAYYNRPDQIDKMRIRGMKLNFSWEKSAQQYVSMYEQAAAKHAG
ncbi:MAG: glycogen synthase [Treponema sp.]|nr:glycogen synthase [Treponema sp.]